jgi:hypothetical protein
VARLALALLVAALVAGGVYVVYGRRIEREKVPAATITPSKRVVADTGCSSRPSVRFELATTAVGVPVSGKIGQHDACEGDDIEHMSGEVDWGDGSSSPLATASVGPHDHDVVIAGQHVYAQKGTFALFARIRAQCVDHGQSTRVISCGSGTVSVQ